MSDLLIRPTVDADLPILRGLQTRQGFEYDFPSSFMVGATLEADGVIDRAILLRKTTEAYYVFDPGKCGDVKAELGKLMALQRELAGPLQRLGVEDVHAWLPPSIEKTFGRVLMKRLGWSKPLWPCFRKAVD